MATTTTTTTKLSSSEIKGHEQWARTGYPESGSRQNLQIKNCQYVLLLWLLSTWPLGITKRRWWKLMEIMSEFETDNLDIYSGESYSVLITTDQNPTQNYWISVRVRGRKPETPRALTLLNYKGNSPSTWPLSEPPDETKPEWNDYASSKTFSKQILALDDKRIPKPPKTYNRRIILLNTENKFNDYTKWAINNVSLTLPATPYLGSIRFNIENAYDDKTKPPEDFPEDYDVMKPQANPNCNTGNGVYMIRDDETVVDVILQNANMIEPGVSEIHPWHLHGHDFWVLGSGEGKFTKADEDKFNTDDPPYRNTAAIFPYGWTALRFEAKNPGVWAFHCHIEPHLHMGMGVVFAERVQVVERIRFPRKLFLVV